MHKKVKIFDKMAWLFRRMLPVLFLAVACTKSQEPTISVGKPVAPPVGPSHTLLQLMDSLPGITIYKAAWNKAGLSHWLDSARTGNAQPFTLFVPKDSAFTAAGLTLDQVNQLPVPQLDSLLLYLLVPGSYPVQNLSTSQGSLEFFTPLTTQALKRSLADPGFTQDPRWAYQYELYMGWQNNTLLLNGHPVAAPGSQGLVATDGVLWPLDSLVRMPQLEMYQVLTTDTIFSYYMAACRYNNKFYQANQRLGTFNDTLPMQTYSVGIQQQNMLTLLVPVNDAFRRAGFNSVSDITAYIDRSAGTGTDGKPVCTNMDSIFRLTAIGVGSWSNGNNLPNTFFTSDLLDVSTINNLIVHKGDQNPQNNDPVVYIPVDFTNDNGQVLVHRKDYPNGRGAHVIAPHDIYTLNGVIHALDNLLIPTP